MKHEQEQFMNLKILPGALGKVETSWLLGFSEKEVAILVAKGHLKPLGRPSPNAPKYFSSAEVERFKRDPEWLGRAREFIQAFWRKKNERQRQRKGGGLKPLRKQLEASAHA